QNLRSDAVIPQVGSKAKLQVGVHRIEPFLLQLVSLQLINEADAAAFLPHIEQNARAGFVNLHEGRGELKAAIAAVGVEYIAGQALGMHPYERRLISANI